MKSFEVWEQAKVWALEHPGETAGVYTSNGLFLLTFKSHRALSPCNCGDMPPGGVWPKGQEPPYGCPVHGVKL